MSTNFDPRANYEQTKQQAGYVERKKATQEDYDRIGFMSGLEVHQQIKTKEWDTAAADAILRAAGGKLLRISDGMPLEYSKKEYPNPPFVAWAADS